MSLWVSVWDTKSTISNLSLHITNHVKVASLILYCLNNSRDLHSRLQAHRLNNVILEARLFLLGWFSKVCTLQWLILIALHIAWAWAAPVKDAPADHPVLILVQASRPGQSGTRLRCLYVHRGSFRSIPLCQLVLNMSQHEALREKCLSKNLVSAIWSRVRNASHCLTFLGIDQKLFDWQPANVLLKSQSHWVTSS